MLKNRANQNQSLDKVETALVQNNVEAACQALLDALLIDTENDHNTRETAKRMAKMYVREVFAGRFSPKPVITEFPNASSLDEVYTLGPITVRSACSHHFVPITGKLWIGILPSDKVIGISKFVRLARWIMARPHIQEEAIVMLADEIEKSISPLGLGLIMDAQHHCMTWRGVKETETIMTSSIMRGQFRENAPLRAEFMQLVGGTR